MSYSSLPRHTALAIAVAFALTACGGGGGGSPSTPAPVASTPVTPPVAVTPAPPVDSTPVPPVAAEAALDGVAVDGYLAGATVFLDANGNGVLDAGEASATTDANGNFHLSTGLAASALAGAHVVVMGGTDTATGAPFAHTMTALVVDPNAALLPVTPLSSLVAAMVSSGAAPSAAARTQIAQVLGLTSPTDLDVDPLTRVLASPALLQKMAALQQALQVLASSDQDGAEATPGPAMQRAATALGAVIAQQAASQSASQAGQGTPPSIGALVASAVATQGKAFKHPAAVQANAQLAVGLANVTEAATAAAVSDLLQNSAGASGRALAAAIAASVDTRLAALAPLQASAVAAARQSAAAPNAAAITLDILAARTGLDAALQNLIALTERLAQIPVSSARPDAALAAILDALARIAAGEPVPAAGGDVALAGGTVAAPVAVDAGRGSARFTVSLDTAHYARIVNFGPGDSLVVKGSGADPLVVANEGADLVITANVDGVVNQITLVGVAAPSAVIGSLDAFNALGVGKVTYQQ